MPSRDDLLRLAPRVAYLVQAGFGGQDALVALLAVGQFTLGCVLEEQADHRRAGDDAQLAALNGVGQAMPEHLAAFEFGLVVMLQGLAVVRQGTE